MKAVWLRRGILMKSGSTQDALRMYQSSTGTGNGLWENSHCQSDADVVIERVWVDSGIDCPPGIQLPKGSLLSGRFVYVCDTGCSV